MTFQYLINQWHVAGPSEFLAKNPSRIILLEKALVIFNVDGSWYAFEDRCPHREFPLSQGKIDQDGQIECPYHGWRFNMAGKLEAIPGLPFGSKLPKCSLKSISCQEYDGLVWLCLEVNDQTRPLEDLTPSYRPEDYLFMTCHVKADYINSFENLLDGFHTPYIHKGLVRGTRSNRVNAKMVRHPNYSEITYTGEKSQSGFFSQLFEPDRRKSIGRYIELNTSSP